MRVIVEQLVECKLAEETEVLGENLPQRHFVPWFHLQGYINTQNNRYWSSQNPHLTHEVPLLPVKVGVWCAVSARNIIACF
jgi:hypothetical protein